MAVVRKTLAEAAAAGTIDHAKVDALRDADVARFNAEDGFDPHDTLRGMRRVYSPAEIRERAGLTQAEMAARLRVPVKTWRNWEQGRTSPDPAVRSLLDLVADDPAHAFAVLEHGPRLTPDENVALALGELEQALASFGEGLGVDHGQDAGSTPRGPFDHVGEVIRRRIAERMEVFGSDGGRIGTVEHEAGGHFHLRLDRSVGGGRHHYLRADMVTSVSGRITLAVPAAEALAAVDEAP